MRECWMSVVLAVSAMAMTAHAGTNPQPPEDKQKAASKAQTPPAQVEVPLDDQSIPREANQQDLGRNLARTLTLLKAGNDGDKRPIRILFYGQSIAAQPRLQKTFVSELGRMYPNANILSTSTAIGGYTAPRLVRTMVHDVVPNRPDLIVFDVYDGEKDGTYEQLIRYQRSHTTADLLIWSHHVDNYGPVVDANREKASEFRREIAGKFNCEFADVRGVWKEYLQQYQLPRKVLLRDNIHNTDAGCDLLAKILARHFVQPATPPRLDEAVTTISLTDPAVAKAVKITGPGKPAPDGKGILLEPKTTLELVFTGNRVDLIGGPGSTGMAKVLIDGKAPSQCPENWVATRCSASPVGWFPGVNRITLGPTLATAEKWTLHVFDASNDAKSFKYRLAGSVTGSDGQGDSNAEFISNSKRIRLKPSDFSFVFSAAAMKKNLPSQFDLKWETRPLCPDEYQPNPEAAKTGADYQTVVNDLKPGQHHLTLIIEGNVPLSIRGLEVHSPATEQGPID